MFRYLFTQFGLYQRLQQIAIDALPGQAGIIMRRARQRPALENEINEAWGIQADRFGFRYIVVPILTGVGGYVAYRIIGTTLRAITDLVSQGTGELLDTDNDPGREAISGPPSVYGSSSSEESFYLTKNPAETTTRSTALVPSGYFNVKPKIKKRLQTFEQIFTRYYDEQEEYPEYGFMLPEVLRYNWDVDGPTPFCHWANDAPTGDALALWYGISSIPQGYSSYSRKGNEAQIISIHYRWMLEAPPIGWYSILHRVLIYAMRDFRGEYIGQNLFESTDTPSQLALSFLNEDHRDQITVLFDQTYTHERSTGDEGVPVFMNDVDLLVLKRVTFNGSSADSWKQNHIFVQNVIAYDGDLTLEDDQEVVLSRHIKCTFIDN